MPSALGKPAPQPSWAVLLYGPPPDLELLARELRGSGLAVVQVAGHFFLQAPEVFDPLSWPEEVAWAGAAILQQLNGALRLRYAVRLPLYCGPAVLSDRDGRFSLDAVERAVAEVRAESPRSFQLSLGEIWTATRNWPHLGRALDLFLLGSAAWNLRETFEEARRDLGPAAESWIDAQDWARRVRLVPLDRRRLDSAPAGSIEAPVAVSAARKITRRGCRPSQPITLSGGCWRNWYVFTSTTATHEHGPRTPAPELLLAAISDSSQNANSVRWPARLGIMPLRAYAAADWRDLPLGAPGRGDRLCSRRQKRRRCILRRRPRRGR